MSQRSSSSTTLLLELGDRVLRSWWTVVAGMCMGLAAGSIALAYLPKVYEATARIWISEQEISARVVESTVKDDMALKLAAFRDTVIADEYMIELIEQTYGLPATDEELTERMKQVRASLVVDTVENRRVGVQAFALAYRDEDPRQAAKVVNTLSALYVLQNAELRKESAVKVADAIQTMADRAKQEFDAIDGKLTRFKQAHPFETEEHLAANLRLLEGRRRDVEGLQSRRDLLQRDLRLVEEELATARARAQAVSVDDAMPGAIVVDPLSQQIALTKRELENLRVRYTETHPEVRAKRQQLTDLLDQARRRAESGENGEAMPEPTNPIIAAIQDRINTIEGQLIKLDADEKSMLREIAEYERRIQVEPEVQRQLTVLEEQHAVAQEKWRRLEREAEGAEGSIDLEDSKMAQQMEVLTEASVPERPVEPDALQIYMTLLIAGTALFVGPMLARHALDPPITSEVGLRALMPVPVLVNIPRILTPANRGAARKNLFKNITFSVLAGAILLSVKFYL